MDSKEFFSATGQTEAQRYKLTEVIGKGSYGVVASAVDQFTGAFSVSERCTLYLSVLDRGEQCLGSAPRALSAGSRCNAWFTLLSSCVLLPSPPVFF